MSSCRALRGEDFNATSSIGGAIAFVANAIALLALRRSGREASDCVSPRDGLRRPRGRERLKKSEHPNPAGQYRHMPGRRGTPGLREREPAVHRGHRFRRRNVIVRGVGAATRDPVRVRRFGGARKDRAGVGSRSGPGRRRWWGVAVLSGPRSPVWLCSQTVRPRPANARWLFGGIVRRIVPTCSTLGSAKLMMSSCTPAAWKAAMRFSSVSAVPIRPYEATSPG